MGRFDLSTVQSQNLGNKTSSGPNFQVMSGDIKEKNYYSVIEINTVQLLKITFRKQYIYALIYFSFVFDVLWSMHTLFWLFFHNSNSNRTFYAVLGTGESRFNLVVNILTIDIFACLYNHCMEKFSTKLVVWIMNFASHVNFTIIFRCKISVLQSYSP